MSDNAEHQDESNTSSKIIGSYLSLITKADSRYEGTLVEVDKKKKTMSLKNVKNMGTEGRRNGVNELPPGDSILGTVKFRVDLVKTFEIIDKPEEEQEAAPEEAVDPAIVSSEDRAQEQEKPKARSHYKKEDDWSKGVKVNKESAKKENEESSDVKKAEGPKKERILGELQPVNEKYQKKFDEAYDFNKHQMDDSRKVTQEGNEKKEGEETKVEKPKYEKTDFFDNITNSTLESNPSRGRGRGGRGGGYRGGYRGGGDDAFGGRGGYRGRGGGDWNDRGRGGFKNWREAGEDPFAGTSSYRGRGGGYRGRGREDFGERKQLYSDTLRDPNDPNFHKRDGQEGAEGESNQFFDKSYRGRGGRGDYGDRGDYRGRGEYRGRGNRGRGRGRPMTGEQAEKRDEETFGSFTSQNFKFNHEQNPTRSGRGGRGFRGKDNDYGENQGRGGRDYYNQGRGGGETQQRGGRGGYRNNQDFYKGNSYSEREPVVEDGHKDFFDVKKKPGQNAQRAKNRFAGLMNIEKNIKKNDQNDDDSDEEVTTSKPDESTA